MAFICGNNTLANREDAMNTSSSIAVIADGHSIDAIHGGQIATFVCDSIIHKLSTDCTTHDPEQWYETMPHLFQQIHDTYLEKLQLSGVTVHNGIPMKDGVQFSGGTTATCAVFGNIGNRAYIMTANVGDSAAFLFVKKNGTYTWKQLTTTHNPTSYEEYRRIQKRRELAGHCIYETKGATTLSGYLPIFAPDGTTIRYKDTFKAVEKAHNLYHNARNAYVASEDHDKDVTKHIAMIAYHDYISAKKEYESSLDGRRIVSTARNDRASYLMSDIINVKISITRSIGDYAETLVGVTCEPSVHITWLDQEDLGDHAVFFMATDGILDCYSFEDLAEVVLDSDPQTIISQTMQRSLELFNGNPDDMTFIMRTIS